MNADAVASASRPVLVQYAAAAAANAHDLMEDAEVLLAANRYPRAYSLAALAVEEFGKACGVVALVVLPDEMRAQAPIQEMLGWHRLKQMGGMLMSTFGASTPGLSARVAATPVAQLADVLSRLDRQVRDTDGAKKRGFYVDLGNDGSIQRPADITEAEASDAVARARAVAGSASILGDPEALAKLSNPPGEALELSARLCGIFLGAGEAKDPAAAAAFMSEMANLGMTSMAQLAQDSPQEPQPADKSRGADQS